MRASLCIGLILLTCGCAHQRQYLRPTEQVRGQTVNGYDEAFYELHGPKGRFGETKIWSVGAYRSGEDTIIQLTADIHNTSSVPIELSARDLALAPVRLRSGELIAELKPQETGTFRVQPEARAKVELHFLLPRHARPGDLRSFVFKWRVVNGEQSYAQDTPFREELPRYRAHDRYYLYYSDVYPCSPYSINCVGPYWPYGPYVTPLPPPMPMPPPDGGRRNIDVRK